MFAIFESLKMLLKYKYTINLIKKNFNSSYIFLICKRYEINV